MALNGLDFSRPFNGSNNRRNNNDDRTPAKVWLNVGYHVKDEENPENDFFVSLPVGIPLDTQEELPVRGQNEDWKAKRSAQNHLLAQLKEAAEQLAPGEERIFQLQVQLRRVEDEQQSIAPENNKFALDIFSNQ